MKAPLHDYHGPMDPLSDEPRVAARWLLLIGATVIGLAIFFGVVLNVGASR